MNSSDTFGPQGGHGPCQPPASVPGDRDDALLLVALDEYSAAVAAGERPSRQEFLQRYPGIADDLSACLEGLAFVQSAAPGILRLEGAPGDENGLEFARGEPLGDFRLGRELGRGGMGVVYEAQQLSLSRRVAVKVLPLAAALDPRHLQRFRNEAYAAAQLHHTNIVPVYAVGCERSVHFYAMQLIEGRSLAEVIRETARATEDGARPVRPAARRNGRVLQYETPDFSWQYRSTRAAYFRAITRLAVQAAEALGYAHQMGVVHRDVKPANLLLDPRGNLWVTDFGLAQIYADGGLTEPGDAVGTLRYMSPEQALGRTTVLDERTDIYSLGATLYELLTLERPLGGDTREQILYRIESLEPRPPRSIDSSIPPELETIVLKALAKDPAERYDTARAMAEDLQRFLRDEPIRARPPSLRARAVKWTRRHRPVAAAAAAVLIVVAAGSLVSTLVVAREQAKTRAAYIREREQRARAELSSREAREAVHFFTRIASQDLWDPVQVFEARKQMLGASLDYYERFLAEDHRNNGAPAPELTAAESRVRAILAELSALEAFGRALSDIHLLSEPSVRQALSLSAVDAGKLDDLALSVQPQVSSFLSPAQAGPPRDANRYAIMAQHVEAELARILAPARAVRLRQISRQAYAPFTLTNSDVARSLSLTASQREAIRAIQSEFRDAAARSVFGGPSAAARGNDAVSDAKKAAVRKALAELTPAQVEAWRALTGAPFSGDLSPFGLFGPWRRPPGKP